MTTSRSSRLAGAGLTLALAAAPAGPLAAEAITAPSGQTLTLQEILTDSPPGVLRLRFVAPAITRDGGTIDAETALADMAALCDGFALPRLAGGALPAEIIISLADRALDFGATAPEATQYFAAFTIADGACIPEAW